MTDTSHREMTSRNDLLPDLRREAKDAGIDTWVGSLLAQAADEIQELRDEVGRMRLRLHRAEIDD